MSTTDPAVPLSQPKGLGQRDTWQAAAGRDSGTLAGHSQLKDLAARVWNDDAAGHHAGHFAGHGAGQCRPTWDTSCRGTTASRYFTET